MARLIPVLTLVIILCACHGKKMENHEEKVVFFGDSTLNVDFRYYTDTANINAFRRGEIFEISTLSISGDTNIIALNKELITGCYNGGCEFNKDTLICNYWLDSINCMPELQLTTLVFKINHPDTLNKFRLIFKPTETPKKKICH